MDFDNFEADQGQEITGWPSELREYWMKNHKGRGDAELAARAVPHDRGVLADGHETTRQPSCRLLLNEALEIRTLDVAAEALVM